jgi:Ni,Fe-hydrogenase I large subunit
MIIAAHGIFDHIVHFYHLSALDWVDIVSALKADPRATAKLAQELSPWHRNSVQEIKGIQERLKGFVETGQLGVFASGYWGHPAMKLSPEVNLLAVTHYFQALEYQRLINKVVAILGSKTPHIQNLAVGGVANPINPDSQSTLTVERLFYIKQLIDDIGGFIHQVYLIDVAAVGAFYADWTQYGAGVTNYLSVPDMPLDTKGSTFSMPGGYIAGGDPATTRYATETLALVSKLAGTKVGLGALHSTIGRHAARAIRCAVLHEQLGRYWDELVSNIGKGDYATFNAPVFPEGEIRGVGFHEAPRGVLSHWVVIQDGKIKNYQCVVPSTWNAGPRDQNDAMLPYEASLIGNPVADPNKPLEVLRTIHSFDPCLACAIHLHDEENREIVQVRTRI